MTRIPFPLNHPEPGASLSDWADMSYRDRRSAYRQARNWNAMLADDPTYGPQHSGCRVGVDPLPVLDQADVGPNTPGEVPNTWRYRLVWIPVSAGGPR